MPVILRIGAFLGGAALAAATTYTAVETFVLPRGAPNLLTGLVMQSVRLGFKLRLRFSRNYRTIDRVMAFYAPFSLLALLPAWLFFVALGYSGMYWALGGNTWAEAWRISGSSLLTLGYASSGTPLGTLLEFSEATLGLMLVALLIAYLPSMYSAFARRERAVSLLEVRAGQPPSAVEMLLRYQRIHGLDSLSQMWAVWETWFADLEESHTSLAALVFFRSPQPGHSWVTAAGTVLDAAALTLAAVDKPFDAQAALCIRAGYLALQQIADFFDLPHNPEPRYPRDNISISREMFAEALQRLEAGNIPLKADREQAWLDYAGWRVNYDQPLLGAARLTLAPPAPWTGPRDYPTAT